MKTKIIDETFNKDEGITTVTIQNKYGHFTGIAYCHPDDEYSMFQGERIAATRANIKFCKFRITQEKAKLKALENIHTNRSFENNYGAFLANFDIRHQLYNNKKRCKETIEHYQDAISILKKSIKKMDEERQKILLRSKKNK